MKKRLLPFIFFALFVGFSFAGSPLNLNWNELGPNNAAGRTRTVLYDNRDASGQTMYTGGVAGGIWKSTNLGLTWHQVNTADNKVLKVSCMAQSSSGTIYVGTGEMSCFKGSFIGSGIYRSDDGETFTQIQGTQPLLGQTSSDWAFIQALAIDGNGRVYAATSAGLKYSDDGNTWTVAIPGNALDVKVTSDNTVLAAVGLEVFIAQNGNISNFVNLSTGTATTLPTSNVGYTKLAVSKSDANVMYAAVVDQVGQLLNLYNTTDHGNTWSIIFPGTPQLNPLELNGCNAIALEVFPNDPYKVLFGGADMWYGEKVGSGFYNWEQVSFGVGYRQNQIVTAYPFYVPYNHHQYVFSNTVANQFAVATDAGISIGTITADGFSFRYAIKGLEISQYVSVAASLRKNAVLGGAEYIGINILPGSLSTLDPKTTVQLFEQSKGDVAWSVINPNAIFYATGTSASPIIRSEDLGANVALSFNDLITNTNPRMPMVLWESFNFTKTHNNFVIKPTQNIPADTTLILPSKTGLFPYHYNTTAPIAAGDSLIIPDPIAARMFVSGTESSVNGVYMTNDPVSFYVNPKWFRIASCNSQDTITSIAVSKDLSTVWAGTAKGILLRMKNVDDAYDSATADMRSSQFVIVSETFDSIDGIFGHKISSVAIADNNQNVLVTMGSYGNQSSIYLSTNGLDANPVFVSARGNLPEVPVYTSLFEMHDQNRVLIGTDYGVFSTNNITSGSVDWGAENSGLGNVAVTKIIQQKNEGIFYQRPENYGYLYIATLGRGLFMDSTYREALGVNELPVAAIQKGSVSIMPNPVKNTTTIGYQMNRGGNVVVTVTDLSGRTVKTLSLGSQTAGDHQATISMEGLRSGSYIISVTTSTGTAFGKVVKID